MNILEMTWKELEELDSEKTIVLIKMAPIEEHGLHLPLGVDCYLTEEWCNSVQKQLSEQLEGYTIISLPMIPFGCADIGGFPGNLHISQKLVYQLMKEMLECVVKWDIRNIIVLSGHADPKHQIAIEEACEFINKKHGDLVFSPMGAIFSNEKTELKSENSKTINNHLKKYPNDYHAGWIETSLMLYYKPQLVKSIYRKMKDIIIKPKEMISPKKVNRKIAGLGHMGYPSMAQLEIGKALHKDMVNEIVSAIKLFVKRENYEAYRHHELFKLPFLRVNKLRRY